MTKFEDISGAISRVVQKRTARGAIAASVNAWLDHLKTHTWKNSPDMKTFIETLHLADGPADQTLIPGIKPITETQRTAHSLQTRARAPLTARKAQKPCNAGLFDDVARNQIDLF